MRLVTIHFLVGQLCQGKNDAHNFDGEINDKFSSSLELSSMIYCINSESYHQSDVTMNILSKEFPNWLITLKLQVLLFMDDTYCSSCTYDVLGP